MNRSEIISIVALVSSLSALGMQFVFGSAEWTRAEIRDLPSVTVYSRVEVEGPDARTSVPNNGQDKARVSLVFKVENTGLGPGYVRNARLFTSTGNYQMEGESAWQALKEEVFSNASPKAELVGWHQEGISCPYTLKAGAEFEMFRLTYTGVDEDAPFANVTADLGVCVCSMHGDCQSRGPAGEKIDCPAEIEGGRQLLEPKLCPASELVD